MSAELDFLDYFPGQHVFCAIDDKKVNHIPRHFHEGYDLFGFDTEFFESVNRLGLRVRACYEAIGIHLGGMTITRGSESHRREAALAHDIPLFNKRQAELDRLAPKESRRPTG